MKATIINGSPRKSWNTARRSSPGIVSGPLSWGRSSRWRPRPNHIRISFEGITTAWQSERLPTNRTYVIPKRVQDVC
jgi:hypothetical protein